MENITHHIIEWYLANRRELPWRATRDPYKIWLSEIILQQTRVNQGLSYYQKFVTHYPDVKSLAGAPLDEVLNLWQGLGYYSRANNLHAAAKVIVSDYEGRFPETTDELMKIIGIGSYTAAAVASMAFDVPAVVVDGNVFRVLSRLFGIHTPINTSAGKKEFTLLGQQLMDTRQPGTFNQAMMEFGALCCTPNQPLCGTCIFNERCYAKANSLIHLLPVKKPKNKVRHRFFYYFLIELESLSQKAYYLKRRTEKDIWKNLYDLPLVEYEKEVNPAEAINHPVISGYFQDHPFTVVQVSNSYKHKLTHQQINTTFIHIRIRNKLNISGENYLLLTDKEEIKNYPVPRLIEQYLQDQKILKAE